MTTLTLPIILAGGATLMLGLLSIGRAAAAAQGRDKWLVVWPLAGLAGWLTIASAVNVVTLLTRADAFPAVLAPVQWALAVLAAAAVVALAFVGRTRLLPYALTFSWGLIAVAAAEWSRHPVLAYASIGGMVLLALTLWQGQRRAPIPS